MKKILLFVSTLFFALGMNAQILFNEDFESMTAYQTAVQNGWFTIDTSGADTLVLWKIKSYSGNKYPQISAYHKDTAMTFLISPVIDLTDIDPSVEINLSFDVKVAFWKHQGLKVYVTKDLSDSTLQADTLAAVRNANYDLIADTFQDSPTNTYGDFIPYNFNLNNYRRQKIRIVFYYYGNPAENATTTYQIDNVKITTFTARNIDYVYTLNDTTLIVKYSDKIQYFDSSKFSLNASNFSMATFNLNDSLNVIVYANTTMVFDTIPDTIRDGANMTNAKFLAGLAPIEMMNAANSIVLPKNIMLTTKGYVTANDEYNQIWIQDDTLPMHGIMVYDKNQDLPDMVKVGDYITIVGTRSVYNNWTEIAYKALIDVDTSMHSPIKPIVIKGNTIGFAPGSSEQTADDPNIEPYEGLLIQVNEVNILSGPTSHYEYICTDDDGTTNFVIDDEVDYKWDSYDTISLSGVYQITGVLTFGYGFYRLNPLQKDYNGMVYLHSAAINNIQTNNFTVYPNPVYNELNITAQSNINKVELFNSLGQSVKSVNINASQARVNVADLQPGVYMVRIYTDKGISTSKIIKR